MAEGQRSKVTIVLASLAILLAGWLVFRGITSEPPRDSLEHLTVDLTIRCEETGEEWSITRGWLEEDLYTRTGFIDPSQGLANPSTGKRTGFPVNREKEWDRVVERINAEKQRALESRNK